MKRKASNAKGTSRKTGCPRGRPPSDPSEIGPNCNCGGVSGCTLFCQQFFFPHEEKIVALINIYFSES